MSFTRISAATRGALYTLLTAAALAGAVTGASAAETKWVPGTPYPEKLLDRFPCHDYTLPCGNLPPPPVERVTFKEPLNGDPDMGEKIATNLRWGNCIACHNLPGRDDGGTIGPDLTNYAASGLPPGYTYQRIWDVRVFNPNAHMPVYGPNKALTEQEIRDVMAFLYRN